MIIAMWSGPRNLSTAMMRSFGSRADCSVFDEPFFAPFLQHSGKNHPGRQETLALCETDPLRVAELCAQLGQAGHYSFQKQSQRRFWDLLGRPPIIHSETILENPKKALKVLCKAIDILFDPAMLSWEAGQHVEDGPWAPWWYKSVWASTGFARPSEINPDISPDHFDLLEACRDDYKIMADHALKIDG